MKSAKNDELTFSAVILRAFAKLMFETVSIISSFNRESDDDLFDNSGTYSVITILMSLLLLLIIGIFENVEWFESKDRFSNFASAASTINLGANMF